MVVVLDSNEYIFAFGLQQGQESKEFIGFLSVLTNIGEDIIVPFELDTFYKVDESKVNGSKDPHYTFQRRALEREAKRL